jgi:acyl-CoA oxidase
MSKLSNHAVVFAKLIIDGKAYGVHAFMVQTRNLATWELLPGIECGDIGPKFGYNSKDNGFMLFKNVRIPRTNMLKRFAEVTEEGKIVIKSDMRRLYGIMLETRVWIAGNAAHGIAMALSIAGRYSVVRRQFSSQDGTKLERKLLDYQTHMFKFAPLLAYCQAFNFASQDLFRNHTLLLEEMKKDNFDRLDFLHHLTAGYKAVFSRIAYDGIDSCRQACGGAGFSAHSGLPAI